MYISDYTILISKYWLTFTVLECGHGMELLEGYYYSSTFQTAVAVPISVVQVRCC